MNGRNFLDLALLVPGVSPTNIGSTQLFAETSAVPGQGISVASQRNLSNNFIVDGLSANDDAAGLSGIPYGVDAVEQFQVVTSGGQAELGRALGGYINVVTKSGTNTMRGTLYDFFRDDDFNAAECALGHNAADGPAAVRRQPWRADRAQSHVLLLELRAAAARSDRPGHHPPARTPPIINARLAAVGYPGSPVTTGIYPNPVHSANILGKVDHQVSGTRSAQRAIRLVSRHVATIRAALAR